MGLTKMKHYLLPLLFIVGMLAACKPSSSNADSSQETSLAAPVAVTRSVITTLPNSTPAICTPLPEGMTLDVMPTSATEVKVELTGLHYGETITLLFTRNVPEGVYEMEAQSVATVEPNGRFIYYQAGFPAEGNNTWQVKVIHMRGVACAEVKLP